MHWAHTQVHLARHAAGAQGRALRRPKRYAVTDSPLSALRWWRVMLDEAQNVGDGYSQVCLRDMHPSGICCLHPGRLASTLNALRVRTVMG